MRDPEPELIQAVARLDEKACTKLVHATEGLVRAAVRQAAAFSDVRDEEEIQNTVRMEVIRSLASWDRTQGRFSTWVYAIARNVVNNFRRRETVGPPSHDALGHIAQCEMTDPPDIARPVPGETMGILLRAPFPDAGGLK